MRELDKFMENETQLNKHGAKKENKNEALGGGGSGSSPCRMAECTSEIRARHALPFPAYSWLSTGTACFLF